MDGAEKGYYKKSDMTLENVTEQTVPNTTWNVTSYGTRLNFGSI